MKHISLKSLLIFVFFLTAKALNAQVIQLNTIGSLTNTLTESSGLCYIEPNKIYTHNDSGGGDEIFEIDTLGNLIRTITINSANNSDWEDITKDNLNNIYIGDFGNNNNDRTNLRIYKIPSPSSFSGNAVTADIIEFNYPDQTMFPPNPTKRNFDAEGFVWYDDSLFIFTKNRTSPFNGYCKMYKIPATPGVYTAQICDSVFLCADSQPDCWVTSAALSPDNSHLALLNNNKIWWFSCFNGSSFFKGAMATATLSSNTQKEAITFKNNHDVFISDELSVLDNSGGKLYLSDMSIYLEMPYVNIEADSVICDNCTLSVDSFIGALSWSNGLFGPSITPTYTGWYTVNAKNYNNCIVSDSVYVSYLQSVTENQWSTLQWVLNESSNNTIKGVIYSTAGGSITLTLSDISGKKLYQEMLPHVTNPQNFMLPVNLTQGIYLLHFDNKAINKTYKIVITN